MGKMQDQVANALRDGTKREQLRTAEARIAELEGALAWYAKDYDYERGCSQWDGGAKARAALTGSSDYVARRDREVRDKALQGLRDHTELMRKSWAEDASGGDRFRAGMSEGAWRIRDHIDRQINKEPAMAEPTKEDFDRVEGHLVWLDFEVRLAKPMESERYQAVHDSLRRVLAAAKGEG